MKRLFLFFAVVSLVGMLASCNKEPDNMLNGHEFVDLGLPSGTKWATCNVGAETPEAYGDYFAWGDTIGQEFYNWSHYKYCNGDYNKLTKYCDNEEYGNNGFTDELTTLEESDDVATAKWGKGWRMPTREDLKELIDNCDTTWTAQNGINGMLFTSRTNGNSIFLPAAGHPFGKKLEKVGSCCIYWSSSLSSYRPCSVWNLYFDLKMKKLNVSSSDYSFRDEGHSVRPVCAN